MNRAIMKMNQGYRSVCRLNLDIDASIRFFGLANVKRQVHDMIEVVASSVSGADLHATGTGTFGVEADPLKRQIHRDILRPVSAMEHLDRGTPASLIVIQLVEEFRPLILWNSAGFHGSPRVWGLSLLLRTARIHTFLYGRF
jgi:hypothetical protein